MRKRCLQPGCDVRVHKGSYCVRHLPYRGNWSYLRALVLKRDGYRCQINGSHCMDWATTVDHVNGDPNDNAMSNLRAACRECNSAKGGVA